MYVIHCLVQANYLFSRCKMINRQFIIPCQKIRQAIINNPIHIDSRKTFNSLINMRIIFYFIIIRLKNHIFKLHSNIFETNTISIFFCPNLAKNEKIPIYHKFNVLDMVLYSYWYKFQKSTKFLCLCGKHDFLNCILSELLFLMYLIMFSPNYLFN